MELAKTYRAYFDNLVIHSYVAPSKIGGNATHVIEGRNSLIVVDPQFTIPYAFDFRQYIENLDKPIDFIFISHSHPDHYLGLVAFKDVDKVCALPQTIQKIREDGPEMIRQTIAMMGPQLISDELIVPKYEINAGEMEWGGHMLVINEYYNAESDAQLTITIPKLGVLFGQDLLYDYTHLFVADKQFDNWMNILREFKTRDYRYFLAGHGPPTDNSNILDFDIHYLQVAKKGYEMYAPTKDKQGFKNYMIQMFPKIGGLDIFSYELDMLFI